MYREHGGGLNVPYNNARVFEDTRRETAYDVNVTLAVNARAVRNLH
jgi:hypothetical protein